MKPPYSPSLLVTGASGFIGSFIVEHALQRGYTVWAAVRPTSSRRYLTDPRIRFVELDLDHEDRLRRQVEEHRREHGPWEFVIHAAGATKCADADDFDRVNHLGTRRLVSCLLEARALERRFVLVSSLSVTGPVHERDYAPITADDEPRPNTAYGRSKLAAERFLAATEGLDYVVLRPTGVYGPREKDYFLMARSVKQHVDTAAGLRRQIITFIYVRDLAEAALQACDYGPSGRVYLLSDDNEYSSRDFSRLLQEALGVRFVLRLSVPLWVLRAVCAVSGRLAARRGKASTLNPDKYNIMKQRNWKCDIDPAIIELGFRPEYNLERGVTETVAWYKQEKWL